MWRRVKDRMSKPAPPAEASRALDLGRFPGIEAMLDAGDVEAARNLVAGVESGATPEFLARADLQLRHEAFVRAAGKGGAQQWPPRSASVLNTDRGLPEIKAESLNRDTLVAGVQHNGALLVRGLFSAQACADLRDMIDATMATHAIDPDLIHPKWNIPFSDLAGNPLSPEFRRANFDASGRPVPDTPVAAQRVLREFTRIGLRELVEAYFGERPALTLEKWTLRRVPPDTGSSWHQDGAFLGTDLRTLNLWVALSECGETASGLDIVARRFDRIVPTGTPGAFFDWDVAPDVVDQQRGEDPIVSPVFEPGDAIFFDHFLLHRTGVRPSYTRDRYALESWFFTPSSYPGHYEGLLL